jgi:hypothetical protein
MKVYTFSGLYDGKPYTFIKTFLHSLLTMPHIAHDVVHRYLEDLSQCIDVNSLLLIVLESVDNPYSQTEPVLPWQPYLAGSIEQRALLDDCSFLVQGAESTDCVPGFYWDILRFWFKIYPPPVDPGAGLAEQHEVINTITSPILGPFYFIFAGGNFAYMVGMEHTQEYRHP